MPLHFAAMRRAVLIMLMLILPLQWSWAAVAEACRHEPAGVQQAHLGHHEHGHAAAEQPDLAGDVADESQTGDAATCDADCATCHGQGSLGQAQCAVGLPLHTGALIPTPYVRHVPDHVIAQLLRPPLPHLV